ncbi:hypothetical protein GCM10023094_23660 [Rhodococcus olei]|uniref:Uncharacterized protein n=1 Tax=Rhodococcus olei TaxID=2161675 RepID=A0ABP8P3R2_9NOCA
MPNSRTLSNTHLLAPRDADDRMARAQFVLAMLTAVAVLAAATLLVLALA